MPPPPPPRARRPSTCSPCRASAGPRRSGGRPCRGRRRRRCGWWCASGSRWWWTSGGSFGQGGGCRRRFGGRGGGGGGGLRRAQPRAEAVDGALARAAAGRRAGRLGDRTDGLGAGPEGADDRGLRHGVAPADDGRAGHLGEVDGLGRSRPGDRATEHERETVPRDDRAGVVELGQGARRVTDAEQDGADETVLAQHELGVAAPARVGEGEHLVTGVVDVDVDRAHAREVDVGSLEPGQDARALVRGVGVGAGEDVGEDAGLVPAGLDEAGHLTAVLGALADGVEVRERGGQAVVDDDPAVDVETTTRSAARIVPSSRTTWADTPSTGACRSTTRRPRTRRAPIPRTTRDRTAPPSASSWRSIGKSCGCTTVTSTPRASRPRAASSPSRPPPRTTAVEADSAASTMRPQSSTVRKATTPSASGVAGPGEPAYNPSVGGTKLVLPVARTSSSHVTTRSVPSVSSVAVRASASTAATRDPARTSMWRAAHQPSGLRRVSRGLMPPATTVDRSTRL